MESKTKFSTEDFTEILSNYDSGKYKNSNLFTAGSVQTNILIQTTKTDFVFRYYENRSIDSVLFESNLIKYLKKQNYPCPGQFKNRYGKFVSVYNDKPYILFEFIKGKHIENPDKKQKKQIIKNAAKLHNITKRYRSIKKKYRWNYNIELFHKLAQEKAMKINTGNSRKKLKWFKNELFSLKLPESLPKGIGHCDFHFSNILFRNDKFVALLDFDDANYTFLMFDLVNLMDYWCWEHTKILDFDNAKNILTEYIKYRPLNNNEKKHLYDLYKFQILVDCVWYFDRGEFDDFYEKTKIDYLNDLGREEFYEKFF